MKKYKIALIGTHGTGKTTLAHEITAELKKERINAEFLGEVARTCPFPINEDATREAQEWIIYNQYIKEIELKEKCDVLICDRSTLDGYVYHFNKFRRDLTLETFVKEKAKTYDILIKIPLKEGFLNSDGTRSINRKFQKDIDKKFNFLLKQLDIPYETYENLNTTLELIKRRVKY